jgi:hypothetical protein
MTEFTLAAKAFSTRQLKQLDRLLKESFEGLNVTTDVAAAEADNWATVSLSGNDELIATNYLRKEFALCPVSLDNVQRFSNTKGYAVSPGKKPDALQVDVGVYKPTKIFATLSLRDLQVTLADGRKLALQKVAELFALSENLPIDVTITAVNKGENCMEAELATKQLEKFAIWRSSLLDRLIALGATLHEIKRTLKQTGLQRDIIRIEPLGIFEHALVCKLGTDAAGLISWIGRDLRETRFAVFSPRRIREVLSLRQEQGISGGFVKGQQYNAITQNTKLCKRVIHEAEKLISKL